MKIHVVRHGEAGDDIADSYGGAADFRLTDNGREGAHAAACTRWPLRRSGILEPVVPRD